MDKMIIQQCVLGSVCTNCYFLMNSKTKEVLIVDPADEPERIYQMVNKMQGKPVGILLTHGHYDHILAAKQVKEKYEISIYACEAEERLLGDPTLNLSAYSGSVSIKPDVLLTDGQVIHLAGFDMKALHTPGHTAGSCCYYFEEEEVLVSGDMLFCQSVGRTDLPTGSTSQIVDSLHRLLNMLPDEVQVLPGHDMTTTIAHEKRYNPFV